MMKADKTRQYSLDIGQGFRDYLTRRMEEKRVCGEVVMVVPRPTEAVLVMTKAFYPEGVYRLPSGGIHRGEQVEDALNRELLEETGFALPVDRFLARLDYLLRCENREISFSSYMYLMQPTDETPRCSDAEEQITGFRDVPIAQLAVIAEQLRSLPGRWQDWGRFRAIAHGYVAKSPLLLGGG
ncbi:MAG: NUDIX hydrolase [Armatimonadota bacterium]|nr:NUDIX hydrolase [Armatimonadota bacterium]